MESIKKLEDNWSKNQKKLAADRLALGEKNGLDITSNGNVTSLVMHDDMFVHLAVIFSLNLIYILPCFVQRSVAPALDEVSELKKLLQKEAQSKMAAEEEVNRLKLQITEYKKVEVCPENLLCCGFVSGLFISSSKFEIP